jgi:Tol biopolymer transport system component
MSISPGTRLGPYEVLSPLGAGGMGQVFRARDLRLGRDVALKVLPERLAGDEEMRRRFEREARAVAALSHPNILALHDVGRDADVSYAVTEMLEGQTLRTRLSAGALAPRKAVEIAAAIAEGLAAAHAKAIVHRDIKPENVFVTSDGQVKILDFGLAREQRAPPADGATGSLSPTDTEPGTVLGTVGYMSPEQVRGAPADHRTDIFALGCVLYEMLAGRRAFARDTAAETMTAILKDEPPDFTDSGRGMGPDLARLVARALEKNPEERFQSARDLAFALRTFATASGPAPVVSRPRRAVALPAAVVVALSVGVATGWMAAHRSKAVSQPTVIAVTSGPAHDFAPVLSPDGKFVAYLSDASGRSDVWVKFIGGGPPVDLTADKGLTIQADAIAGGLDISPDGSSISFEAGRTGPAFTWATWLIPAPLGGAPRKLIDAAAGLRFSPDGTRVVFTRPGPVTGDSIVGARADGQDERVLVPGESGAHKHHPAWSADGKYVYYVRALNPGNVAPAEIWRVPGGGGPAERVVATAGVALNPLPGPDGRTFLFAADRPGEGMNLWARPMGGGQDRRITTGIGEYAEPRLSRDGRRLVCAARRVIASLSVVPTDATGLSEPSDSLTGRGLGDSEPSLSARGDLLAFSSTRNGVSSVWIANGDGNAPRQLTSGPDRDESPALSPDGSTVAFVSNRGGQRGIWLVPTDGGVPRHLADAGVLDRMSWSPDGRRLVFADAKASGIELHVISREGGAAATIPGVHGRSPSWSPIGEVIATVVDAADGPTIRFVDLRGQEVPVGHTIDVKQGTYSIAWSPDGKQLAFGIFPAGLEIAEVATGRVRLVATFPNFSRPNGVAWSADQSKLIFGRIEYASQVLLLDGIEW